MAETDKNKEVEEKRKSSNLPPGLGWFVKCIRLSFVFRGRARRREFWFFTLYSALITILPGVIGGGYPIPHFTLLGLVTVPADISVSVRRMHDIGRSGWWILLRVFSYLLLSFSLVSQSLALVFFSIAGFIAFFVFSLLDSQRGANKYGENPKSAA